MPDGRDAPRFFVRPESLSAGAAFAPREPFAPGAELLLPRDEAHHAAHVLRLAAGSTVIVFDGRGASAEARLVRAARGEVAVVVEAVRPAADPPRPAVRLAFAVPKGRRLDWLLEKATELGAARLAPVRFARSVAGGEALGPATRARWEARCIAAAKQAGVDWLPAVEPVRPLAEALPAGEPALFGDTRPDAAPLAEALAALAHGGPPGTLHIYVGPEGGLTEDESRALCDAGAVPVRLGRTVLRTETAAVALLAATAAILGAC